MGRRAKREQAEELTIRQRHLIARNTGLAYEVVRHKSRNVHVRIAVERLGDERAISEALYGLVKAAIGYDKSLGYKFSTYATPCIIRQVVESGQVCGRLSEARRAQKYMLRMPRLGQFASLDEERTVLDLVPAREPESPPYSDDDLDCLRWATSRMPERLRAVLSRRQQGDTLKEIASDLGVSKERVRQIEGEAVAFLREQLRLRDGGVNLSLAASIERKQEAKR